MLSLIAAALLTISPTIATGVVSRETDRGVFTGYVLMEKIGRGDTRNFHLVTTNIDQEQFLAHHIGHPVRVIGRRGERSYQIMLLVEEIADPAGQD